VNLRHRLAKLEQQATALCQRKQLREASVFEPMERWEAYRRGKARRPPPPALRGSTRPSGRTSSASPIIWPRGNRRPA
jgi:hypothetical protein